MPRYGGGCSDLQQIDRHNGALLIDVLRWFHAFSPVFLERGQEMRDVLHAVLQSLGSTAVLEGEVSAEPRITHLQSVRGTYLHSAVRLSGGSKLLVGPMAHATFLSPCANRRFDRMKVCRRRRGVAQSAR